MGNSGLLLDYTPTERLRKEMPVVGPDDPSQPCYPAVYVVA